MPNCNLCGGASDTRYRCPVNGCATPLLCLVCVGQDRWFRCGLCNRDAAANAIHTAAVNLPNTLVTQGCSNCGMGAHTTPAHLVGELAETILGEYFNRFPDMGFAPIKNGSEHGLDFLSECTPQELESFISEFVGNDLNLPPDIDQKAHVIYALEVKANVANLSGPQQSPEDYVFNRLSRAIKGEYGPEAQANADKFVKLLDKGAQIVADLIRVVFTAGQAEIYIGNWGSQDGGGNQFHLVERLNLLPTATFFSEKAQGTDAENRAQAYLNCLGFTNVQSLQNGSGNGIDVIAKHPATGNWCFFEVKSGRGRGTGTISGHERGQRDFVKNILSYALNGQNGYTQAVLAWQIINDVVGNTNPGWENSPNWANLNYFKVDARYPDFGQTDIVRMWLTDWAKTI